MDSTEFLLPRRGTLQDPIRLAVLISGSGSGMEALLTHQHREQCCHETVVVLSNKAGVAGLKRAENRGIQISTVELPAGEDPAERRKLHEDHIEVELQRYGVEVVILSGYMRVLTPNFVSRWLGRLLNIHPSLLPDFPGAHAHRDVLAAGVDESGCTVHFVDTTVDSGPIIAQSSVLVLRDDDLSDLQARIKLQEHRLYPQVIDALCEGRIRLDGDGVRIIK